MIEEVEVGLAAVAKSKSAVLTIRCTLAPQKLSMPGYRSNVEPSPQETADIADANSKVVVEVSREVEVSKEVVVLNLEMDIKGVEMNQCVELIIMFMQMPETLSLEGFKFNALPSLP